MAKVDPTYGVNEFNKTKVLSETETYVNNILTILFGKPGFYPSIPTLGMDISQYLYKFEDEINVERIKAILANQCSEFLPLVESGDIDIIKTTYMGRSMLIFQLPVIIDKTQIAVALGVTLNAKGQMVYKFQANDEKRQYI
jgi:hypothetical protein